MRKLISPCLCALLAGLMAGPALAAGVAEPLTRPAALAKSPQTSALLAITRAGNRLVAVGERGIVILSDDAGQSWRQAPAPVSVTLTAVQFASATHGWAVGHAGVILNTTDGGETWSRQLDGMTAARLVLDAATAAEQAAPEDPAARRALAEARQLMQDGPDKPFFDVHFDDENNGIVVGAYNLIFATHDGGRSWQPLLDRLDNPRAYHLHAVAKAGDRIFLAGEQGLFLRSEDGGRSFARVATPYGGSYFALALLRSGEVVLAGMRGALFRSLDHGANWQRIESEEPVSFTTAAVLGDSTLILANHAGNLFLAPEGQRLQRLAAAPLALPTGILPLADGGLIAVGMRGVSRIAAAHTGE